MGARSRSRAAASGWSIPVNVHRRRLVEWCSTSRLVAVEAPSGAGKSTLLGHLVDDHDGPVIDAVLSAAPATLGQLHSRLQSSLRRHGLSDVTSAAGRAGEVFAPLLRWAGRHEERLLVQLDDLHLADAELAAALAELCDRWPRPHRLVLAGRRLPEPLRGHLVANDSVLVGPDELRFRAEETHELFGRAVTSVLDDADVAAITRRCNGWAAAVHLAAVRLQRAARHDPASVTREAVELASGPATVRDLLDQLLGSCPPDQRAAVIDLAALPAVDDHLVRTVGLAGVSELHELGLPLTEVGRGLYGYVNAVRDALATATPNMALARRAARHYLALDVPEAALEVLAGPGQEEHLAGLLADLPPAQLGRIDARELGAAVAALPRRLLREHPRILVDLADANILAGHADAYVETVRRADALVIECARPDDDPQVLEVRALVLARRAVASNDDGLVPDLDALLSRPDLPPVARARLNAAAGRAIASRRTAAALRAGAARLDAAVGEFRRVGASAHAIGTQAIAAAFALLPLGRYDEALDRLAEALDAVPGNANLRVAVLPYRAFALVDLGRYAEAESVLAELRQRAMDAEGPGNERAAAYARWAAARLASQQGDAQAAWAACRAVASSAVPVDTGNGAFFHADAAQILARVGWFDEAREHVAEAHERDPGNTAIVTVADFVVAAHLGDREAAERALAALDGGAVVEPRERWRITLLQAKLAHDEDDPRATALAAAAFEEAAQLGHPDLALVREPEVARQLLSLAESGSASARDAVRSRGARLRVLGGFEVEEAGRRTEPAGRPAQLLAHLALHDRQVPVEAAIEGLWPETEPERGRERLRTVLRRLRRDHGDLVERHDELLRLREGVTVDVEEFLELCRRVERGDPDRERAAATAIALYGDGPVPGLGPSDWVEHRRRHLEHQVLAMHDALAEETAGDGRLDDAIRWLFAAMQRDPLAESRYLDAARLLAEQGRRARALRLLEEGRALLAEHGLAPTPEFDRLVAYLARNPESNAAEAS